MQITNPVNQVVKMPTLTESYAFASTESVIEQLGRQGWYPSAQSSALVRKPHRQGFQRHIVRFQNDAFPAIPGLTGYNQSRPEIVAMNAHDGTTALRMLLGFIRMICLNGNIAGIGLRSFRAFHTGSLTSKMDEGVAHMTAGLPDLFSAVQKLQQLRFTAEAKAELVDTLARERLKAINLVSYDAGSVEQVRRSEDREQDAFTVFNRVQESLIRGGISYTAKTQVLDVNGNVLSESLRNGTTRKVTSIPMSVRLNTLAFDTALRLAS